MFKPDTSLIRTVGTGPEGVRLTKIVRTHIMHLINVNPMGKVRATDGGDLTRNRTLVLNVLFYKMRFLS